MRKGSKVFSPPKPKSKFEEDMLVNRNLFFASYEQRERYNRLFGAKMSIPKQQSKGFQMR